MKEKIPHYYFFYWTLIIITLVSQSARAQTEASVIPHRILVKLDTSVQAQLAAYHQNQSTLPVLTGEPQWDQLNQRYGVERIRRVFPAASRFETAHRRFGLHRWYEIVFGDTLTTEVQQLLVQYQNSPFVALAEPAYLRHLGKKPGSTSPNKSSSVDDPRFVEQWHYDNTGQSGGTPYADIRLTDAWAIEQGDPNVIVAIIDGGIDTQHEDLRPALWVNRAEQNGLPAVDDDGNGYVDDVHGYNFGDDRGRIIANAHGTHVAGTVGAVSHNGVGVAGVAGGSGAGDGVRLMSCAVFGANGQGGFPAAFVYAADHGAVIAQNSWGGGEKSNVLEAAIRYFIERAGYDNSNEGFAQNRQIGPMAGGLVVFAAGNEASPNPDRAYPASLPTVLTVAATDHHDRRSHFSNYGEWIDIAAPGSGVLSTHPGNSYDTLSGTSMASPHVSGVAALLVSRYQQPGLQPEHVRQLLLTGADPLDEINPAYPGKLGRGRLNAYRALMQDRHTAPGAITDMVAQPLTHDRVRLRWTASGGDSRQGTAARYELRYATFPITTQNFDQATVVPTDQLPSPSGTRDTFVVAGLTATTPYYFALRTRDLLGTPSALSNQVTATTLGPPEMTIRPAAVALTVEVGEVTQDTISIGNLRGQSTLSFSRTISPETSGLQFANHPDTVAVGERLPLVFTVDARRLTEGNYESVLTINSNDPAAPQVEVPISVTVVGTPLLSISSAEVDLGPVWTPEMARPALTFRNYGTGTLTVSQLATRRANFRVDTTALVLRPGESRTVTLSLASWAEGPWLDTLVVQSDDAQQPVRTIPLSATVVPPPSLAAITASLTVELTEGDTAERRVQLRSVSSDSLAWTLATADQPTWWAATPPSGRLAPGDTAAVRLRLDATRLPPGTYRHTLVFRSTLDALSYVSVPMTLRVIEKIVPLTFTNGLPDQRLPLRDTTYRLNLTDYLSQSAESGLQYIATSEDSGLLHVSVEQDQLLLSPRQLGTTTVQVGIRDAFDQEARVSFRVDVIAPNGVPKVAYAPEVLRVFPSEQRTLALADFFADPDQDQLTYTATSSDPAVVEISLLDSVLTLMVRAVGGATVMLEATDPAGAQASLPLTVEVAAVTATEDLRRSTFQLSSYPNPADEQLTIAYELPYPTDVRLTLHDKYGRLVRRLVTQQQTAGLHTVHYSVAELSSGVYLLRLLTPSGVMTSKLVVR